MMIGLFSNFWNDKIKEESIMNNLNQNVLNYEGLRCFYEGLQGKFAPANTEEKVSSALTSIN